MQEKYQSQQSQSAYHQLEFHICLFAQRSDKQINQIYTKIEYPYHLMS